MTRAQWIKEYSDIYLNGGTLTQPDSPTWIIELAVRYGRLKIAKALRTQTEFKMEKLCAALDVKAVKATSDVWKYMVVRDHEDAKAMKKAKPKEEKPEVTKSKRPTAAATVLAMLREKPVRSDEQIIAAVHAATFHDGFNASQLAWYRSQFKQGRLKGQNGKPEIIHETTNGDATMVSAESGTRADATKASA